MVQQHESVSVVRVPHNVICGPEVNLLIVLVSADMLCVLSVRHAGLKKGIIICISARIFRDHCPVEHSCCTFHSTLNIKVFTIN